MEPDVVTIRSFRQCFALERRIHRLDRWRLPVPYGVPVRGIAYAFALPTAGAVLGRLVLVGPLILAVHPAIRYVVLPVSGAWALTGVRVDGRVAHVAALGWLRLHAAPRRLVGFRAAPAAEVAWGAVAIAPDERAARLRRAVVHGPGAVVLRYPFSAR